MGTPWVRLDTSWPTHPKTLTLVEEKAWRALLLYPGGLCYSGANGTDGFVPAAALPLIFGSRPLDAEQLVAVNLWTPAPGGYEIHDWADYQLTNVERLAARERASHASRARWGTTPNGST